MCLQRCGILSVSLISFSNIFEQQREKKNPSRFKKKKIADFFYFTSKEKACLNLSALEKGLTEFKAN